MNNRTISASIFAFALFITDCGNTEWSEPFPDRLSITISDSIGVELGDSCYIFGSISDAEFSQSGEIYVLDRAACSIRKFSKEGTYLQTLSRRGSGPGEMLFPTEIAVMQNGNVVIRDQGRSSLTVIDRNGDSINEFLDWSLGSPPEAIVAAGNECVAGYQPAIDIDGEDALIVLKPAIYSLSDAEMMTEFNPDTMRVNIEEMISSLNGIQGISSMVSDGDRIFYARSSTEEYEVRCWDMSGEPFITFTLNIPRSEKTEEEIQQEKEYIEIRSASMGIVLPDGFAPDPFNKLVEDIGLDCDGNIWIQRGTEVNPVFDVVNAQGEHVATAEYPKAGKFWKFRITPYGSLAWNQDPESGVQRIFLLDLPEIGCTD